MAMVGFRGVWCVVCVMFSTLLYSPPPPFGLWSLFFGLSPDFGTPNPGGKESKGHIFRAPKTYPEMRKLEESRKHG
jgi:hypothetical protein